jgi:hypothetical protein
VEVERSVKPDLSRLMTRIGARSNMLSCMGRGRLYTAGVLGVLVVGGAVARHTWPHISAGPSDPVADVIGITTLAVTVVAFWQAARAQKADTDIDAAAERLAAAVRLAETKERMQLLGGQNHTIDVQFTFHPALAHDAAGADSVGTLKKVVNYYRKLEPRRMVITGAAGSGKTVLAVELILGLLDGHAAGAPVPVRISAATLDTSRPADSAIEDWLAEHLRQAYKVPEAAARKLVAARMVVPVLDGLDEMDAMDAPGYASRAGQAIRACNAYLDGVQKAAMILTCRINQYEALEQEAREWVQDAARIQLRPVSVATARSFLTSRVTEKARWRPVLDQMRRPASRPLAAALSTPWRLTLAATVYDQRDQTGAYLRDPVDLTSPQLDTEDAVRDHLLALFIPATLAAHKGRYTGDCVHRWLAVLASYLDSNTPSPDRLPRVISGRTLSGTDLVLHELWPLAGSRRARLVTVGALAVFTGAGLAAFLLTRAPIGFTRSRVLGAIILGIAAIALLRYSWTAWPQIQVIDLRLLKTRQSRRELMYTLSHGPGSTIVAGTALVAAYTDELGILLALGITFAFAVGLAMGLAVVISTGFRHYSVVDPRQIVRTTYVAGIIAGLTVGLVAGIAMGPAAGIAIGLAAGLVAGLAGIRYSAFLLCTRRWSDYWLPWRLGHFLHWCYEAGLIRTAGISYQFRHQELQDYLARNPGTSKPGRGVVAAAATKDEQHQGETEAHVLR